MPHTPDLSICIVNHRTPELLRACLYSIQATATDLTVEVLVVNNTSDDDGAVIALKSQFPNVRWFQNDRPLGFAANQNRLLQQATGRYLMPLNSDTVIQFNTLQELIAFMDQHPQCGMAGPRLTYPGGELQPSCRNFPSVLLSFLEASGVWRLFKGSPLLGRWYYLCSPHDKVSTVDWLTGACLIVRRDVISQIGYYNSRLFPEMYGEDIDWCWRIKRAGWLVMFDPAAVVVHLESQSPLSNRTIKMYRGFYKFCEQHYFPLHVQLIRSAIVLALLPRRWLDRDPKRRAIFADLISMHVPIDQ